jgi:outer membrane protein
MKKWLLFSLVLSCSFLFADSIGYIDSQLILKQYNKALAAQSELANKQKDFQDTLVKKQAELETARAELKDDAFQELKEKMEKELQPKRDEVLILNQQFATEIEQDIMTAAKKIARQLRVDVVLDKQVVILGGMDLTSLVLSKLNNN